MDGIARSHLALNSASILQANVWNWCGYERWSFKIGRCHPSRSVLSTAEFASLLEYNVRLVNFFIIAALLFSCVRHWRFNFRCGLLSAQEDRLGQAATDTVFTLKMNVNFTRTTLQSLAGMSWKKIKKNKQLNILLFLNYVYKYILLHLAMGEIVIMICGT